MRIDEADNSPLRRVEASNAKTCGDDTMHVSQPYDRPAGPVFVVILTISPLLSEVTVLESKRSTFVWQWSQG